jgi:hypothetical protein
MAYNRRLVTDQDFREAMERQAFIRVFQNDYVINSGGVISNFDDNTISVHSSVSELTYHLREQCEFFEMKKK